MIPVRGVKQWVSPITVPDTGDTATQDLFYQPFRDLKSSFNFLKTIRGAVVKSHVANVAGKAFAPTATILEGEPITLSLASRVFYVATIAGFDPQFGAIQFTAGLFADLPTVDIVRAVYAIQGAEASNNTIFGSGSPVADAEYTPAIVLTSGDSGAFVQFNSRGTVALQYVILPSET